MSAMQEAARQYVAAGYTLAAWERIHGKGPREGAWGLQPFDPEHVNDHHNIGMNHALSCTAVLDADDLALTRQVLESFDIDVDALAKVTMTWCGNPDNRMKLAFRCDAGLNVKKLVIDRGGRKHTVFELRGAAPGKQFQDVLPPSMHPDTRRPYQFITELRPRAELPELPAGLLALWHGWKDLEPTLKWLAGCETAHKARERKHSGRQDGEHGNVIGQFNAKHTAVEIIERNGYTAHGKRWLHPDSTTGVAGVIQFDDGFFYAHGGGALADDKPHDAFDCYRILEHNGDMREAVRAAAGLLGINSQRAARTLEAVAGVTVDDFHAYMPMHQYIFAPSGEMWPSSSVNSRIPAQRDAAGNELKASEWLDRHRAVEQMTWFPGEPPVIEDRLISNGGWITRPGCRCFNLYRPPQIVLGNPQDAGPWIEHVWKVYPDDAAHLILWLAHRRQRPADKVNHAIVLGGSPGIGKDTILEPVKYAVGPWNFADVTPGHMLGRFNGFVKSVIVRVSEARDLGDVDRFAFHDHMKVYTAAPPDVLRCDEKHLREHAIPNVCGVVITTNHKSDGLYLPADDRRHYVAWSELTRDAFQPDYWTRLYRWFEQGGHNHVAAYLQSLDLSGFDPKAPPPKTPAFYDIVDANRAPEDADLADVLDLLGNPKAITLDMLVEQARHTRESFHEWLTERKNRRVFPHRLETADYIPVRNDATKDGLWKIHGKRQAVYGLKTLSVRDRIAAVSRLGRVGAGQ